MEPKVTTRLAEYRLIVVVHLLVADAARVDGRRVRVLRVEHHRLIRRVNLEGPSVNHLMVRNFDLRELIRTLPAETGMGLGGPCCGDWPKTLQLGPPGPPGPMP